MSQVHIQQFIAVTSGGTNQAKQFLEMSGGDINTAIMLFFDSGVEPQPDTNYAPPASSANKQTSQAASSSAARATKPAAPSSVSRPTAPAPTKQPAPAKPLKPAPAPTTVSQSAKPTAPAAPTASNKAKFNTMADFLDNGSESDKTENEYFAGSGQKIRAQPKTIKEITQQEAEQESGCKITLEFYDNGVLINGHEPFYPFDETETMKFIDEMKSKQTLPPAILNALPQNERPKPGQPIYTEVKTRHGNYEASSSSQQKGPVYTFSSGEKARTLDGSKAPAPSASVSAPAAGTRTGGNVSLSLNLVPNRPVALVRVKADKTYTVQTNPDCHTIKDLIECIRKAGADVPAPTSCLVKVVSTSTTISDISLTVAKAQLERQQVILLAK